VPAGAAPDVGRHLLLPTKTLIFPVPAPFVAFTYRPVIAGLRYLPDGPQQNSDLQFVHTLNVDHEGWLHAAGSSLLFCYRHFAFAIIRLLGADRSASQHETAPLEQPPIVNTRGPVR